MEKNKTSGNYPVVDAVNPVNVVNVVNAVNPVDDPCDDVVHWLQKINESLKTEKETRDD